ncbi:thioredoxin family protein [Haloarcula taiwanensis]|uniref:Thioredoxin family protein n=1 Tax=Haloarcula taiwanensis TaxID=1932004 RepID=A0A2H5A0Y6_9EURY|nr:MULTISPECIES: glutaredoxin family protein [Haloarcula]AUG48340.1 thioredoxin family protein [Haloarcula taiwanensis]RLM39696.1 glutaredoxin family protein [Haloarcula sp. Atlit-120R]RLM47670.1 glutaredoxin family protein [Haloarcula sp. Atlit-47R]
MSDVSITVYTREDCHLCEKAIETIEQVADDEEVAIALDLVDVDEDPELQAEYGERVPYVFVDESPAFKYHVDERQLREKLQQSA